MVSSSGGISQSMASAVLHASDSRKLAHRAIIFSRKGAMLSRRMVNPAASSCPP